MQRLVAHAEEVAYNDPPSGASEQLILNQHLYRLLRHNKLSAFQRFVQQVFDGYFVKYFASVVALLVYAAPIYLKQPDQRASRDDITQDYIRSMRLLQNTSKGVGDLVLVYKRITGLAGHTSRVAELLEQVLPVSLPSIQLFVHLAILPSIPPSIHPSFLSALHPFMHWAQQIVAAHVSGIMAAQVQLDCCQGYS